MVFSAHSKKSDNAAAEIWQSVVGDPTPKNETTSSDDVAAWKDFWNAENNESLKPEETSIWDVQDNEPHTTAEQTETNSWSTLETAHDSWSEPELQEETAESERLPLWSEPESQSEPTHNATKSEKTPSQTEHDGWSEEEASSPTLWSEPDPQSEPTTQTHDTSEQEETSIWNETETDSTEDNGQDEPDSFFSWGEPDDNVEDSTRKEGEEEQPETLPQQDDSFFDWGEPDATEDDSVENSTSEGFWSEEEQSTVDNIENFWGSNEEQPETLPQQSKKTIEVSDNPAFWGSDEDQEQKPQQSKKTIEVSDNPGFWAGNDSDNNETTTSSWNDDFLETVSTPEEPTTKPFPIKPIIIGVTALTVVLALVVGGLFGVRALRTKQANQESCQALQEVIAEYQQVIDEAGLLGLKVSSRQVGCSDTAGNRQAISELQHAIRVQKTKNTPALTKAIEQRQAQLQALQSQYPDSQALKVLSVPKKAEEFASFDKRLAQLAKIAQQEADKKRQEAEQRKAKEEAEQRKAEEQAREQKEAENTQSQQYTTPQQQYQKPQQPYIAPSIPAPQPTTPTPQPPSGNADVEF